MKTIITGAAALATAVLFAGTACASILTSKLNVDNGYAVYISTSNDTAGTSFGSAENWNNTYTDTTTLAAGTDYYLHIRAYDLGGMAGVLGEFSLAGSGHHFANGTTSLTTDTTSWLGNDTGFSSPYVTLSDLGPNGIGPWGTISGVSSGARWIWAGDADANDVSYLSARILADAAGPSNNVPEPGSVALVGAALLGLARTRSKKR
jgi:MSHA biogenesis protein MshQ